MEATSNTAARVELNGTPLTAPGGEFHIDNDLRQLLCYMDNGVLLISKSHALNPHVRGFMGRLTHMKRTFQVQAVDLTVIEKAYAEATTTDKNRPSNSQMQIDAKEVFSQAFAVGASDIHFRVSKREKTQVHFRVNGDLEQVAEHSEVFGEQMCTAIYQALADVSDATFEKLSRQDARISARTKIPAGLDGIRIATSPQVDGFLMVLRLLYDSAGESNDLGNLGYNNAQKQTIEMMKSHPTGINILAGPTGSGKSTTLKRVLSSVIEQCLGSKHVLTVEDPPEYRIVGAVQTPVTNADTEEERSRKFQQAIKAAMRLDPDVIMIGEVRDAPSGSLAIQAAMTGHQVWTTVHANSAFAIVNRLIDLGLAPNLVTDSTIITGLTCQRLVKLLCPNCKLPLGDHLHRYQPTQIERVARILPVDQVYVHGPGCDHCRKSGNKGRTVVAETVQTDDHLMTLLREHDRREAMEYWRDAKGGATMLDHAVEKIGQGIVDPFQAEHIVGLLSAALAPGCGTAGGVAR